MKIRNVILQSTSKIECIYYVLYRTSVVYEIELCISVIGIFLTLTLHLVAV